jgi:RimJ/RimL family protein N-acetyltransferase
MKLRPMVMADAKKMLEWKNYPETRRFAIQSRKNITLKNHVNWLKKNIQYFQIINDGQGAIRVQDKEISIWIDREHWGKGLATEAIKLVSKKGYTAKIVMENLASAKAFVKAGFKPQHVVWKK